ncbi:MAG TPA: alpha/beta hydrolase-fold protein [Vicinamibacterales bacterium]|nr:alpha/beta hydrolase-fold protein [Vicinamibacterales bacterium]
MPKVPVVPMILVLVLASCNSEPTTWKELRAQLPTVDAATQDALVEKFVAAKGGTPIVENQTRLIFLAKDRDGQTPRIVGDFNNWAITQVGYDVMIGKPTRIEGTSWSFLESTSYTNARLEYVLFFDKDAVPDPLNRHTVQAFAGPRSEVRMPFFVAQPEVDELGSAPKGEVIAESFQSRSLGGSRRVWYYLPPGYAAAKDTLYPVIYVLDGANYVEKMEVPKVLDHLIANQTIPPVIAVFSEPADRQEEYSRSPKWRGFITNELVPSVDKRFRTFPTPDHRVILGSSLAAYGAIDLAVTSPSVFGLCAAIAPPVQTATVVSNQAAARAAVVSIKFFVMGGVYDSMIDGARRLHTTLDEYSAPVTYLEVSEGHNTNTFRAHLDDALKALLPQQ